MKTKKFRRFLLPVGILLAVLVLAYCLFIFAPTPGLQQLRSSYIQTAMSTLRHRWLATGLIPRPIIDQVMEDLAQAQQNQQNVQSSWGDSTDPAVQIRGQEDFFALFPQLPREQVLAFTAEHPQVLEHGWDKFYVNQSGLKEDGLPLYTTAGDQVLAIDAQYGILVLRVKAPLCQGVLAICADPSRLLLAPAQEGLDYIGTIAESAGGVLAITASGFVDSTNSLAGYAMYSGQLQGDFHAPWHKRLELRTDNRLYITDALDGFHPDCTDAMEFTPALIADGISLITDDADFSAIHPRVCLGQDETGRLLLLALQGRTLDSIGATAADCVEILQRYRCRQAMNLDGGNSAMLWYRGAYLLEGARSDYPQGRQTINAWVYCAEPVS
jgi:exopolysaccharide biosynthesis protein